MARNKRARYVVIVASKKATTAHGTFYERKRAEDFANRLAASARGSVTAVVRPLDETTLSTVWGLH